ncbi:MAG TPA: ferritin-like domain-containing protein [Acidimicrobiales bacterium]|nr:ferritin-like domain-containing protein [Acidimicrobiales bacterium]
MSTRHYAVPVEQTKWNLPGHGTEVVFNWEYDEGRDRMLSLYEQGKDKQWNTNTRVDWSIDIDFADQGAMPDYQTALFGSEIWDKLSREQKDEVRLHQLAWTFSQFLHGEQGALICTAKIVETVPDVDSKFYAATQVIDEARHVETYARYLNTKVGLMYPINPHLQTLLDQTISDSRWDFTYLGMQMMVEGVALGAFGVIRDLTEEPLTKSVNAYVMSDEARHVAFGIAALQDAYRDITEAERSEREEFVVEASYLLRDRFLAGEVWERLGLPVDECCRYVEQAQIMGEFRKRLFSRIVPNVKKIGLWGPKIQAAFLDMGVLDFQDVDVEGLMAQDEDIALELDRILAERRADGAVAPADAGTRAGEIATTIAAAD